MSLEPDLSETLTPLPVVEEESSWGYTDLLIFAFLSLIAFVIAQLSLMGMMAVFHLKHEESAEVLLPSQIVMYFLLFAILYSIIKLQGGRSFWSALAWKPSSFSPAAAVFFGIVLAIAIGLLAKLLRTPDVDSPMKHLLERRSTTIEFAAIGITLGPFIEELVFRGFVQPVLVRSVGAIGGILLTAMMFGALHLAQNAFTWQSGVLITLAGAAFGIMRQLSGSTRDCTWMHMAYNSTFFLALFAPHAQIPNS